MSSTSRPSFDLRTWQWLGLTLAVLGAALFATKGIVIKLALVEGIDPVTTLTWRMIVAVPIFVTVGILAYRRRAAALPPGAPPLLTWPVVLQTLGVGVLGYYVASLLDFSALEYISAQFDRLILLTYPFFVVLFGAVFFKRKVTGAMIVAQVMSYIGIAIIRSSPNR
jgi:drug/metabolite transporter (DMT)-like permease